MSAPGIWGGIWNASPRPGTAAIKAKGFLMSNRWLIARRFSQVFFLALFLAGPMAGIWIVKGTLASSLTLGVLPLSDPFIALQSFVGGHVLSRDVVIGALIVLVAYGLIGGRVFCSWVCPVNPLTDGAHLLRERLGLDKGWQGNRHLRYGIMGTVLLVSFFTGTIAWEVLNPVTLLHRELVYGTFLIVGSGWSVILGIFLFDFAISRNGWCGRLCPVGAFYSLIGRFSLIRFSARRRSACTDCMDCYAVCPEPHVITPALTGARTGDGATSPLILSSECTNCGRCADVCSENVYVFTHRFDETEETDGRDFERKVA